MRILVMVLERVCDLGLSAVLDPFQAADELTDMSGLGVPRLDVHIVGVREIVSASYGLRIPVRAIGARIPDSVIVPAVGFEGPPAISARMRWTIGRQLVYQSAGFEVR